LQGASFDPLLDTLVIAPSGSETFTLRLEAAVPGTVAGPVSLETSDADENPFDFGVTGSVGATIIDDGDPGYDATGFRRVGPDSRFYRRDYEYLAPGADGTATWSFTGLTPAKTYQVALTYYGYHNRATDAPLTITGAGGEAQTVYVNQRQPADDFSDGGVYWENVAIVTLAPTSDGSLTLELSGSDTGYVIADAARVEPLHLPTMDLQLVDNGSTSRVQYGQVIDFGTALQMTAAQTKVFIITNGGEVPLVLRQPTIDSGRYQLAPYYDPDSDEVITDPGTGQPVDSVVLQQLDSVAFAITQLTDIVPGVPGTPFDATVSIQSNDVTQPAFEFFVTGSVQEHFLVVDDGDPGFDAGNFRHRPGDGRFYRNDYHFQTPGTDGRASWTFVGLDPGVYRVSATWFAWHNRANNAAFRSFDGAYDPSDTSNLAWTVPVDQTMAPDSVHAANWQEIGLLNVTGDTAVVDVLSGLSDGYVIADAVRLDFLGGGGPPRNRRPELAVIENVTLQAGSPLQIPLDGFDLDGDPLTFEVIGNTNAQLVSTSFPETGSRNVRFTVEYTPRGAPGTREVGDMVFRLFEQRVMSLTDMLVDFVNEDAYDGFEFWRVINDFMIQAEGANKPHYDDAYHVDLQHNRTGLLAVPNPGTDDQNGSGIYVTEGPSRHLDYNLSIAGLLLEGEHVRAAISDVAVEENSRRPGEYSQPVYPVIILDAAIEVDTQNEVLMINAPEGSTGATDITIRVSDGTQTAQRTFHVDVVPDTYNSLPFLGPITDTQGSEITSLETTVGTPIQFVLTSFDVENDAVRYQSIVVTAGSISTDPTTGLTTYTPPTTISGSSEVFEIRVGVTPETLTADQLQLQQIGMGIQDTQILEILVTAT
jgi:cyclophilin family peptidyl-prolyl cis-trans isomerase